MVQSNYIFNLVIDTPWERGFGDLILYNPTLCVPIKISCNYQSMIMSNDVNIRTGLTSAYNKSL